MARIDGLPVLFTGLEALHGFMAKTFKMERGEVRLIGRMDRLRPGLLR